MKYFLDGAIMAGFCIAALFFLKFWLRTHDRLFLMFSISFGIMALNRVLLTGLVIRGAPADESQMTIYLIRLAAYVLILIAIFDKNRSMRGSPTSSVYRDEPRR